MKRTHKAKGFTIHIPRVAIHEPGVYEISLKDPSITVTFVKKLPMGKQHYSGGDKEGGSSDAEESG